MYHLISEIYIHANQPQAKQPAIDIHLLHILLLVKLAPVIYDVTALMSSDSCFYTLSAAVMLLRQRGWLPARSLNFHCTLYKLKEADQLLKLTSPSVAPAGTSIS